MKTNYPSIGHSSCLKPNAKIRTIFVFLINSEIKKAIHKKTYEHPNIVKMNTNLNKANIITVNKSS
jgi:hypothetical protein